jgi:hypothetical protein
VRRADLPHQYRCVLSEADPGVRAEKRKSLLPGTAHARSAQAGPWPHCDLAPTAHSTATISPNARTRRPSFATRAIKSVTSCLKRASSGHQLRMNFERVASASSEMYRSHARPASFGTPCALSRSSRAFRWVGVAIISSSSSARIPPPMQPSRWNWLIRGGRRLRRREMRIALHAGLRGNRPYRPWFI